ncbi:hypothetical protein ABGB16_32920 [Micromonospora sp. B11E3]|uniref:hypothetical protein n=1 Tax=Micromonospora sp. B11E3 TaxID=3153562 RepID=UPI00325C8D36
MNDDLRAVDWESLQAPYGPASDVPRLLQTLRSPDPAARGEAEEQLEDHLQHQGLVYEPAAAAAPYLIDLLADQGSTGSAGGLPPPADDPELCRAVRIAEVCGGRSDAERTRVAALGLVVVQVTGVA